MCFACGAKMGAAPAKEEPAPAASSDEVACPSCGTMVAKDAVMCYACGSKMGGSEAPKEEAAAAPEGDEIACPSCGTMIAKDAVMCYACGEKIEAAPPVAVKKVSKKRVI
jgi:DNA-directed RNA polymerase subunit RPC12/RpoP